MPFDLPALAAVIIKAEADIKANLPLPPPPAMTEADALAALKAAQPKIAAMEVWIKANPGALRALGRVLGELSRQGYTWAAELDAALSAGPGALSAADSWIPTIISALGMFQPAAIGVGGVSADPIWHPGAQR